MLIFLFKKIKKHISQPNPNIFRSLFFVLFFLLFTSNIYAQEVLVLKIEEAITPLTASKISLAIEKALKQRASCLVIELDTPGGLVTSTRGIVKSILNSPVPIVVYVAPSGAQAASAGTFILLAAHIAAMAPGTNVGAAHPVTMGKKMDKIMAQKIENDLAAWARSLAKLRNRNYKWAEKAVRKSVSITAEEALKLKVIDLIAPDLSHLLEKIHGRKINTSQGPVVLHTQKAKIVYIKENLRSRVLKFITDPNIAYILLLLGLAGLYFELSHPGVVLPGVVGAISLLLAFYAMHVLPVNYAGVGLILLSGILFLLEIKITSYGLLALAGFISLLLGSLMLFGHNPEGLRVSYKVMFPVVGTVALFLTALTYLAARAVLRKPTTGAEALIGKKGKVISPISENGGQVLVEGEIWQATSKEEIPTGEKVEVEKVEGLVLEVRSIKKK